MSSIPFVVEAYGRFERSDLVIRWRDERRPASAELDALVETTWRKQVREAERDGRMLFNGELARRLRHEVADGRLLIDAGPTDYAQFLGTNYFHHRDGDRIGWELFSNPIGTSVNIITNDGWILLGRRNMQVACHAGFVHNIGGGIEARERNGDGCIDAFSSIEREIEEEIRVHPSEIDRIVCLGLIRDTTIRQPELVFDAAVSLCREEIAERLQTGEPDAEHEHLVSLRDESDALIPFLTSVSPITPIAVGSLFLHGRCIYGEPWYTKTSSDMEWSRCATDLPAGNPASH